MDFLGLSVKLSEKYKVKDGFAIRFAERILGLHAGEKEVVAGAGNFLFGSFGRIYRFGRRVRPGAIYLQPVLAGRFNPGQSFSENRLNVFRRMLPTMWGFSFSRRVE